LHFYIATTNRKFLNCKLFMKIFDKILSKTGKVEAGGW
jgi:hypothetical protein